MNTFHCADSLEFLKTLPDKYADLCLTDPPYGIGEAAGKNMTRDGFGLAPAKDYGNLSWDNSIPSKELFDEIMRVSKNQIIWGGNYFANMFKNSSCWLVWHKDNNANDFADCELAWTSFKSAVRYYLWRWNGMLQEPGYPKDKRYHPTQKPENLFIWCLNKYSKADDIIIDPFAGSCTTAIAAYKTGRKFICIDKEQHYIDIGKQRYKDLTDQGTLL